jgi:predicted lipoprotein with Yx(FWY)xxD motif
MTRVGRRGKLLGALVAGALVVAACGNDDDEAAETAEDEAAATTETTEEATETTEAPDESEEPATDAVVQTGETDLGPVLTDADGFTLYGFEPDEGGTPTCEDDCADAWPPLTVDGASLPEGLDSAVFSVVQRSDGSNQLAAGGWPLYTYSGDSASGDTNGQSVPQWWVVTPDGELNMTES